MAKRADSTYLSGARTDDWLKIKTSKRQEVVIAGFTAPRRTRPFFGALALAVREKNSWRYIGHVGTGFSHETLEELHGKLMPLKTAKSPFPAKVKDEAVTTWVKPSLVAEVKFTEWTSPAKCGIRSISGFGRTSGRKTSSGKKSSRWGVADEPASDHLWDRAGCHWRALARDREAGTWSAPGDLVIERENFRLYIPIATSLLISLSSA